MELHGRALQSSQQQGDLGDTVWLFSLASSLAALLLSMMSSTMMSSCENLHSLCWRDTFLAAHFLSHCAMCPLQIAVLLGVTIILIGVCAFLGWYSRRRG